MFQRYQDISSEGDLVVGKLSLFLLFFSFSPRIHRYMFTIFTEAIVVSESSFGGFILWCEENIAIIIEVSVHFKKRVLFFSGKLYPHSCGKVLRD